MAFTYDPNLTLPRDWIRFQTTDTVENKGPRIDSKNYSDEEIAALLLANNDDRDRVVAQIYMVLASEWIQMAISYTIGPRKEELYRVAELYNTKAQQWARIAGIAYNNFSSGVYRAGSRDHAEHT